MALDFSSQAEASPKEDMRNFGAPGTLETEKNDPDFHLKGETIQPYAKGGKPDFSSQADGGTITADKERPSDIASKLLPSMAPKHSPSGEEIARNFTAVGDVVSGFLPFVGKAATAAGLYTHGVATGSPTPALDAVKKSSDIFDPMFGGYSKIKELISPTSPEADKTNLESGLQKINDFIYSGEKAVEKKYGKEAGATAHIATDLAQMFAPKAAGALTTKAASVIGKQIGGFKAKMNEATANKVDEDFSSYKKKYDTKRETQKTQASPSDREAELKKEPSSYEDSLTPEQQAKEYAAARQRVINKTMPEEKAGPSGEFSLRKQGEIEKAFAQYEAQKAKEQQAEFEHYNKYSFDTYTPGQAGGTKAPFKLLGNQRFRKGERGEAKPELLAALGLGGLGVTLGYKLFSGDSTEESVAAAFAAGVGGLLFYKAPSAYRSLKVKPESEFVDTLVARHGIEYEDAAREMWKDTTPEGWASTKYGRRAEERYLVDREILQKGYELDGLRKEAGVMAIHGRDELTKLGITPEVAKEFWDIEDGKPVSPKTRELYEEYYKPIVQDLSAILKDIASLSGKNIKEVQAEFMPRMVMEKKGAFKTLIEEGHLALGGRGSTPYGRTLFAVDTPQGVTILHVGEKGKITAFINGNDGDLGFVKGKVALGESLSTNKGPVGVLREATRNEVEAQTQVRYWEDAMSTALIKRAEAQAYADQLHFWRDVKDNPRLGNMLSKREEAPSNFRTLKAYASKKLPQFNEYSFEPRAAEAIEDLVGREGSSKTLEAINNIATKNLLLNPLPHIHNEVIHLAVAAGFTNLHRLVSPKALSEAIESVRNQDSLQMELMKHGMNSLYPDRWMNNNVHRLAQNHFDAFEKTKAFDSVAANFAMKPVEFYNALSKKTGDFMWMGRDVMNTLLAQMKIRDGMEMGEAVRETMKDMPSYRIPPRIGEEIFNYLGLPEDLSAGLSRGISQYAGNPLISAFFRYHYAFTSEFGNMAKEGLLGTTKEKLHALDKAGALMAMYFAEQALSGVAQYLTDNENAHIRLAGPLHLLEKVGDVAEGKEGSRFMLALSIFSPPIYAPLVEAAFNHKSIGGQISHETDPAGVQFTDTMMHAIKGVLPRAGMMTQEDTGEMLAAQFDIVSPSEAKVQKKTTFQLRAERKAEKRKRDRENR